MRMEKTEGLVDKLKREDKLELIEALEVMAKKNPEEKSGNQKFTQRDNGHYYHDESYPGNQNYKP